MTPARIHVACSSVAELLREAPRPTDWLAPQEQQRLALLRSDKRRDQFLAARWQARRLLAWALGGSPADWPLTAMPDAPPTIQGRGDLHLSISHGGDRAAAGVALEPIGLDIEAPSRRRDIEGLAQLCCTPSEMALMQAAADPEAEFYALWTAKEAWLKRRREWIAPRRLRQLELRPAIKPDVRTWSAAGWTVAVCGKGEVRWWTDEPASVRHWQVSDAA